jgi:UDPglucose 6-dehydrogenase
MNVTIIGSGYVGLVSGTCFAEFGANVTCIDKDENKIEQLLDGNVPLYEPGLDELVQKNIQSGRLNFSTQLADAVPNAELVFIAVGTPARRGDGHADLKYVFAVASEIAQYLKENAIVINKSTVPVGTARQVRRIIEKENPDLKFNIASNPEFLREGSAIEDFMRPDRVVIGVENEYSRKKISELYRPLNLSETPILSTDLESAELIKYASNAFLATKISFINEMSLLCEKTGADIHAVSKGMGLDTRIGNKFLNPGPGYGGSCFPKDTLALVRIAQEFGASSRIVESVIEVNASQKARMVAKIRDALGGSENDKKIGVLGLTFKPETDDMRDSPSLTILPALVDKGATIIAHDPQGIDEAQTLLPPEIIYKENIDETIEGVDALVLMTEWNQYRGLDLDHVKSLMKGNIFIDLRNVYERDIAEKADLKYFCIGR